MLLQRVEHTLAGDTDRVTAGVEFDRSSQVKEFAEQSVSGGTTISGGAVTSVNDRTTTKRVSVSGSGVSDSPSAALSSRLLAAAGLGGRTLEYIVPKVSAAAAECGREQDSRLRSPLSISLNGVSGTGLREDSAVTFCSDDNCFGLGPQTARRAQVRNNRGHANPGGGRSSSLCVCKFLLGEDVAGYLVGRKGGGIDEFQKRNGPGLRVTVSKRGEVFPVLGERIAAAVGVQGSIAKALEEIVDVATKRAMHKEEERRLDTGRKISKPKVSESPVCTAAERGSDVPQSGPCRGG